MKMSKFVVVHDRDTEINPSFLFQTGRPIGRADSVLASVKDFAPLLKVCGAKWQMKMFPLKVGS